MIRIPGAAILGLVAVLSVGSALAADEPDELMPGRIVFIRTGLLAKFIAKATTSFDLPDANNAPTAEGASLAIFEARTQAVLVRFCTAPPGLDRRSRAFRPPRLPYRDRRRSPSFSGNLRADVIPGRPERVHTPGQPET